MPTYKRIINLVISMMFYSLISLRDSILWVLGIRLSKPWVILYYHTVADDDRSRFSVQMDSLLRLTTTIPASADVLPNRMVRYASVTFDDVSETFYRNALPELSQRNISCTLFVASGLIGTVVHWDTYSDRMMSADMLRKLPPNLIAIGSHTVSHVKLTSLSDDNARIELRKSKRELEKLVGRPVTLFSFPFGAFNDEVADLCREEGYVRAFTTLPSRSAGGHSDFICGRVRVDPTDWPSEFYLKILGAYAWLPLAISAKHRLMRSLRWLREFARRIFAGGRAPLKHSVES